MSEPLQHDPRTKQQIRDEIYQYLYSGLLKHFQTRLDDIIAKNCVLVGNSDKAFTYKGETYVTEGTVAPRRCIRLNKNLFNHMDEYLKEVKYLNNYELPHVLGYIGAVLNSSNHLHDYIRLLPDSVHRPIEKLIVTCPCKSVRLTADNILEFQQRNKLSLDLMKQRMVHNLLL